MTASADAYTTGAGQPQSTADLIGAALHHVSSLLRGEIDLARAELDRSLKAAGLGVAFIVGAVIVAICALNVLTGALVAGVTIALAETAYPAVFAALIVGAVYVVIAALLIRAGLARLKAMRLAPTRTVSNLRKDADILKGPLQ